MQDYDPGVVGDVGGHVAERGVLQDAEGGDNNDNNDNDEDNDE